MTDLVPDPVPDRAAARWFAIQAVRAMGVAFVLVGLLQTAGKFAPFADLPRWLGTVLVGIGFVDVFVVTRLMARRWRSPPP